MNRQRLSRLIPQFAKASPGRGGLLVLLCLTAMPGCLLLSWPTAWISNEGASASGEGSANVLRKIPTSRTAVTLEIVFVERPINDPLLGSLLWDEIDQLGTLSPADRAALAQAGFRMGRAGANPPLALQTLLGLTTDFNEQDEKRLVGRRVVLPSGAETEIITGMPHRKTTINIPLSEGTKPKPFENVHGVFRMKAKQLQDGWARVEFLPEIHHGSMVNRPVAMNGSWQLQTAQAIERLYRQKFSLDLNVGEMVVITGELEPRDSVGHHFFHFPEFTGPPPELREEHAPPEDTPADTKLGIQRLLIVRLADLSTAEPLYSGK